VDPLFQGYPWNSTYAFAENDVIRSVDLDGLERAIVINTYNNGNIQSTAVLQLSNANRVAQNFNATGNGITNPSMNDILKINSGQLLNTGAVLPFSLRQGVFGVNNNQAPFNQSEQQILNAGVDVSWAAQNNDFGGPDALGNLGGFSFPGVRPAFGQTNNINISRGTWTQIPVFQTVAVPAIQTIITPFPSTTVGNVPLAINPLNGAVAPNPTNSAGFNQVRQLFTLARQSNINNINITIGMSIGNNINIGNLRSQIANNLSSTFNYGGRINVNLSPVGSNQGTVNISSPGGVVRRQVPVITQRRVQTGTTNVLNPN
jgi:hypothetical protein